MPTYLYHLKLELYPSADLINTQLQQAAWLPKTDADIFNTKEWPKHKAVTETVDTTRPRAKAGSSDTFLSAGQQGQGQAGEVIDCGPSRPVTSEGPNLIVLTHSPKAAEFPQLKPKPASFSPVRAVKDWRFGPVRIESVDMAPVRRPGASRTSSNRELNHNGIQASLGASSSGRVTKAKFEALDAKNTEVGWGIVHLYRDGEETPDLGNGIEIYNAGTASDGTPSDEQKKQNADEECTTLCIPAVPSYLTPSDFLGFVGEKTREEVSHFRMVMTGRMNRYLVLMKFRNGNVARKWRSEWDGKVFNSMEPETCHVLFIKSITFQTPTSSPPNTSYPELSHDPFTPASSTFLKPFPPPTPNLVELPTCPVCLERMDDTSGLLTIPCQHVFHCACLQKWRGTGCPVCRHTNPSLAPANPALNSPHDTSSPPFGSSEASLCTICDSSDDLWICLICGNVGCGRYKGGHAKEHWKDSGHNFALEIETQHVWDYADDLWVHRLIRDKGDGKVVELPSSRGSGFRNERFEGQNMDMVPREKLEGIGIEYTHLLTSQLESQRVYFEDLVSKAVAKASAASSAAANATTRADEAISQLKELQIDHVRLKDEVIVGLEKDLAREKKKAEKSSDIARGLGKSLMEEKKVSEGLMERIGHVNTSMMAMSKELTGVKEENADLKEQNRDLLFSITGQQKLREMEEAEGGGLETGEIEGGTVSLPPENERKRGRGKGKGKA